jgi:hypothetical protein
MLRPKLVPKPKQKYSQRQNNCNDPQLEIRKKSTTTRGSVSSIRDWNITQEATQRMISQDSSKLGWLKDTMQTIRRHPKVWLMWKQYYSTTACKKGGKEQTEQWKEQTEQWKGF